MGEGLAREPAETDPIKINRLKFPQFLKPCQSVGFLGSGPMERRDFRRRMARAIGQITTTTIDRYIDQELGGLLRIIPDNASGIEYVDLRRGN